MNVLDSELVVGKLRNEGYELTDDIDQADTILYNTCSRPPARRGQDLQRPRPDPAGSRSASPSVIDRRPRLHGPEGPGADPPAGPRTSTWSSAPASSAGSPSCSTQAKERRQAADGRQPRRGPPARATTVDRELRRVRPAPRAGDAAEPVPGVRPDHDGLRQVLHLLHRPLASAAPSRAGRPAAIVDEARQLADQGVKEITLLGQTVNSYKYREPDGRTDPALRPARPAPRDRRASSGSSSSPTSPTT